MTETTAMPKGKLPKHIQALLAAIRRSIYWKPDVTVFDLKHLLVMEFDPGLPYSLLDVYPKQDDHAPNLRWTLDFDYLRANALEWTFQVIKYSEEYLGVHATRDMTKPGSGVERVSIRFFRQPKAQEAQETVAPPLWDRLTQDEPQF